MKIINFICVTSLMFLFVACSDNSTSPTSPKQPSYYCSLNGITYQSINAYKSGCVAPPPTYYCNLNGVTYQSESAYVAGCISPTYYCNLNGITYTDINQYNACCVGQYCCELTGQCYNSKALYDVQCSTPPSNGGGNNNATNCTTCDCNSSFQSVYKGLLGSAACSSLGQKRCKEMAANQVGCKL